MEEDPKKPKEPKKLHTVYLPVGVATLFCLGLWLFIPEVGIFAVLSAWIGTVLFMSIWGSFYY